MIRDARPAARAMGGMKGLPSTGAGTAPPACVPRGGDMTHAALRVPRDAGHGEDEGRALGDWARALCPHAPLANGGE